MQSDYGNILGAHGAMGGEGSYAADPVNALFLKLPLPGKYSGVVVQFTSIFEDEGVDDIVDALALLIASHKKRRVLVVDGLTQHDGHTLSSLVHAGRDVRDGVSATGNALIHTAHLPLRIEEVVGEDLTRAFSALSGDFPYVLVKSPSRTSIPAASSVDATIIVIEAARPRWQMIMNLAQEISVAGGQIAGAVLNKRPNYIPQFVYKYI